MNNHYNAINEQERFEENLAQMSPHGNLIYAGALLERAQHLFPERIALIDNDTKVTFRQLYFYACECAFLLKKKGVEPGDRVIISLHNSISFYVSYFAVWQLGAIVVPVNTFFDRKRTCAYYSRRATKSDDN